MSAHRGVFGCANRREASGFRMEIAPSQSVEDSSRASAAAPPAPAIFDEFWAKSDAGAYGLTRAEFDRILQRAGPAQNYGLPAGTQAAAREQAAYFRGLKLNDLVLARACAAGHERAWERFVALYHEQLARAAAAITGSETLGREMAGSLYAELYGMTERDGQRRCPLDSYRGKGSLMGWLRTTLAQRHVDHYRKRHREEPLDDKGIDPPAPAPAQVEMPSEVALLSRAVERAMTKREAEDRFVLAAYYLDGRTLMQIAQLLRVHEATVSRRLRRIVEDLRKQVVRELQLAGMSRRAAIEAMGADVRDMEVNLKKLLQTSEADAFQERAGTRETNPRETSKR